MLEEHPFAQYIRILGKGKRGSRGLTEQESFDAMTMVMAQQIEDCQLGAFLMLLRVKEETPEEIAGFVRAVQITLGQNALDSSTTDSPTLDVNVDLSWSSYAGKRRHLPWFLLSAIMLADNNITIFMHGAEGHTAGRIYTRDLLSLLGRTACESTDAAAAQMQQHNFAYLPLEFMSPILHKIIQLRPLLGLRSPVHTIARMLNPFNAGHEIQGIFHPTYRETHQNAAILLKQAHMSVFKGEGGECERNPDQKCLVKSVHNGELTETEWPALFSGPRHLKDEEMNPERLLKVWQGIDTDEYAIASITGTAAIALKLIGRADSVTEAQKLAENMWQNREKQKFEAVA